MNAIVNTIPQTSSLGNFVTSWEYDLTSTTTNTLTFFEIKQTQSPSTNFRHVVVFGQNNKQVIVLPFEGLSTNGTGINLLNSQIGGTSSVSVLVAYSRPSGGNWGYYLSINSGSYNLSKVCSKIQVGTFR